MPRFPQHMNGKGSLKDIQILVNDYPQLLENHIRKSIPNLESIEWVSPLRNDKMAEYRDEAFLDRVGANSWIQHPLSEFWPSNGPQWDALGRSKDRNVFLVEAKANIPEIFTRTNASNPESLELIRRSLNEVRDYLKCNPMAEWTETFYQYANRIAHLYFLRVLNGIPAYLINVYFVGDRSVNGPQTEDEWRGAIQVMKTLLGLGKQHTLSPYILDLFIPVEKIGLAKPSEKVFAVMKRRVIAGKTYLFRSSTKICFDESDKLLGTVYMTNPGSFKLAHHPDWDEFSTGAGNAEVISGYANPDSTMRNIISVIREAFAETDQTPQGYIAILNISTLVESDGEQIVKLQSELHNAIEDDEAVELLQETECHNPQAFQTQCDNSRFVIMGFLRDTFVDDQKRLREWAVCHEDRLVYAKDNQGNLIHPYRWHLVTGARQQVLDRMKQILDPGLQSRN